MHEDQTTSRSGHAPGATSDQDFAKGSADPKFARESFTMRRMLPWQIAALAVGAAGVVALAVFYI